MVYYIYEGLQARKAHLPSAWPSGTFCSGRVFLEVQLSELLTGKWPMEQGEAAYQD